MASMGRGDIFLVNFDPTRRRRSKNDSPRARGFEQCEQRPLSDYLHFSHNFRG